MKLTFEELMRYAEPLDLPTKKLSRGARRRITARTLQKLPDQTPPRFHKRTPSVLLIAVLIVLALSFTVFAAGEFGWFGLDRLFGNQLEVVSEYVQDYELTEQIGMYNSGEMRIQAVPSFTPEERNAIIKEYLADYENNQVPEALLSLERQATVDPEASTAYTERFRYRLNSMLVSPDMLIAVIHVDALTDQAADYLQSVCDPDQRGFQIWALNKAGIGPTGEQRTGGMEMRVFRLDEDNADLLLTNTGGHFQKGDVIRFQCWEPTPSDLFDVPVLCPIEDSILLKLDASTYADKSYRRDWLRITPISLVLHGSEDMAFSPNPEVELTLKDGSRIELTNRYLNDRGIVKGSGSLSSSTTIEADAQEPWIEYSWTFSQIVDLKELASIIIDGVEYAVTAD